MSTERQLTSIGFLAALFFEFKKAWAITDVEAHTFATDCLPAWFGAKGYDWSLNGARALVRDYVETHGE
jgi:hypothetical protein